MSWPRLTAWRHVVSTPALGAPASNHEKGDTVRLEHGPQACAVERVQGALADYEFALAWVQLRVYEPSRCLRLQQRATIAVVLKVDDVSI